MKRTTSAFTMEVQKDSAHPGRVHMMAEIPSDASRRCSLPIHEHLDAWLETQVSGYKMTAIVALAEFALTVLRERGQSLTVTSAPKK